MGCDIHFYVEKKIDNNWYPIKGTNRWYGKFENERKLSLEGWAYSGRNYDLFSVLADVRNNGSMIPISNPRNLPTDVCSDIQRASDDYGWDGHSHSYFTFRELKEHEDVLNRVGFQDTISKLETLTSGDDSSVRVVFWFDN